MKARMELAQTAPAIYKAMGSADQAIAGFELDKKLVLLVQLRISQINGCGYCVHKHSREARLAGEAQHRIDTISTWWEVPFFTEAEMALFKMAEEVTMISEKGLADNTYQAMRQHFSEKEFAGWLFVITVMNSWNRLAISVHKVAQADPS
jgi:AhpD family alkylhydroperoxidase